ncbi:MAG: hypothetical protein IPJ06_16550 [Saprospiraceae bacterium]|nr:hypothetical protein [Saprospiraceae bacterium]
MNKKVVVLYYTQSGQLKQAVDATLAPLMQRSSIQVEYLKLQPTHPFPFPWGYMEFFGAFADTVQGRACKLEPVDTTCLSDADLVILAYQPWFLTISQPMHSFLQSAVGQQALKDKNVLTIIACRNMWINAQEKIKALLSRMNASLVGQIVYTDPSPNLISLVTVVAYVMGGIRGRFLGFFPRYGISSAELNARASVFGDQIAESVVHDQWDDLEDQLLLHGAVEVKSSLMVMEGRGKILFPIYARFLTKNGTATAGQRRVRVAIFGVALPLMILILSPILTLVAWIMPLLSPRKMKQEVDYYRHTAFRGDTP